MVHRALQNCAPERALRGRASRRAVVYEVLAVRQAPAPRADLHQLSVVPVDRDRPGSEQAYRAVSDGVEDRLDVSVRLTDHTQDLARCGLLLQSLLRLIEEAHILDGNDRLIGKGCHQIDLLVRE